MAGNSIYDRFENEFDLWPSTAYTYGHYREQTGVLDLVLYINFKSWERDKTLLYIPFYYEGHYVNLNNSDK